MRRLAIAAVFFAAACGLQAEAEAQYRYDTTHEQLKQDAVAETIRVMGQQGVRVEIDGTYNETSTTGFGEVFGLRKEICDNSGNCQFVEPTEEERQKMLAQVDSRIAELVEAYSGIDCHGITKQGGMVICRTAPNARVEVGRAEDDTYTQTADANGIIIIGFDRDEPAAFARVGEHRVNFTIEPREYDTSRINGLPSNMVNEYTEAELKHIRAATARKKVGFASKVEEIGFKDGFIYPVADHIKTTNFGAQRILNGEPKRPHFGVDLAAPKGTPILAPADGIVSMADDDMYFEGSLILIDHGQGLISYYLHNDEVMVTEGQHVKQGEQIGTVGSRGRSTGPHLCWRLKWRGRNLDPELLTEWPKG